MRVRLVATLVAIAALAVGATTTQAGDGDKATGGGQVLFSTDGGAGNTIAFTAQKNPDGTGKGQVQYIDRSGGFGRDQVRFHGVVDCIEAEGNTASIAGEGRYADGTTAPFQLFVQDNGEPNQGNDIVYLVENAQDPTCDPDDFDDPGDAALARGNAQVTDGD